MQEIDYSLLPESLRCEAALYFEIGKMPSFKLYLILTDAPWTEVLRAILPSGIKPDSLGNILTWVKSLPEACHGSQTNVESWNKVQGLYGLQEIQSL